MKCEAVRIPGSNFEITTSSDATFRCVVCGLVVEDLGTTVMGPDFELRYHVSGESSSCIFVMKRGRAFRGTNEGDRICWVDGNEPPGVEEWIVNNFKALQLDAGVAQMLKIL